MLQQFDRFGGLVHKRIAHELRRRAEATKLDVIKSLGICPDTPDITPSFPVHVLAS